MMWYSLPRVCVPECPFLTTVKTRRASLNNLSSSQLRTRIELTDTVTNSLVS